MTRIRLLSRYNTIILQVLILALTLNHVILIKYILGNTIINTQNWRSDTVGDSRKCLQTENFFLHTFTLTLQVSFAQFFFCKNYNCSIVLYFERKCERYLWYLDISRVLIDSLLIVQPFYHALIWTIQISCQKYYQLLKQIMYYQNGGRRLF